MAKPELGGKRQCLSCGARFFDLNRDPIVCPKCAAVFQVAPVSRSAQRAAAPAEQEEPEAEAGPEIVSLEEADAEGKPAVEDVDLEIEDDDTVEDDTFLEEEEEDADDVADLIDGDLVEDEES